MYEKDLKFWTKSFMIKKNSAAKIYKCQETTPNLLRSISLSVKRDHSLKNCDTIGSFTKCNDKRCLNCKNVIITPTYKARNGTILTKNFTFTCEAQDLNYLLICKNVERNKQGKQGTKQT